MKKNEFKERKRDEKKNIWKERVKKNEYKERKREEKRI